MIVLAILALLAFVPALALHLLRARQPGASDTVAPAVLGLAGLVAIAIIPLNALWWWLCRDYPGKVSCWASARELPLEQRLVSTAGLLLAAMLFLAALWDVAAHAVECSAVYLLWLYVTLAFRAAAVRSAQGRASCLPDEGGASNPPLISSPLHS